MKKQGLLLSLILLCVLSAACKSIDHSLVKYEYRDNYLWNGGEAFEPVDFVMPVQLGEAIGYCEDEYGEDEIYEIIGESRDEWIYVRFTNKWMDGEGQLYKTVNISGFDLETFGISTIELREMGRANRGLICSITGRDVICEVFEVLTSANDIPFPDNILLKKSVAILLLSADYPGLKYETILNRDDQGRKYVSKIEDSARVFEIGNVFDEYIDR